MDINEFVKLPVDFALYDSDYIQHSTGSFSKNKCQKVEDCVVDTINLDITSVFALISSLTHKNGSDYNYTSRLLNAQAASERKKPVLPLLLEVIKGFFNFVYSMNFTSD